MTKQLKIRQAYAILVNLGLPRQQLNDRSALCLLALLDLKPRSAWKAAGEPLMGITPMMDWAREHFDAEYAPNSRETFRRQTLHQFIEAGVCTYNPDNPARAVNSPKAVYQIEPNLQAVLKEFGTPGYPDLLAHYLSTRKSLVETYAKARTMALIPISLKPGQQIHLSAGAHSTLIKAVVEEFGSRYAAGGDLVYVGDTGDKHGFFDEALLAKLGIKLDKHSKLPDVMIYLSSKNWLLLIEAVTSHGPVDAKRQNELAHLFKPCTAGLVYISAFPDRRVFLKYLSAIAWESEVWIADAPSHLIHFNGDRFLGPYT